MVTGMRKHLLITVNIVILVTVAFSCGCRINTSSTGWQKAQEDKEWISRLNQFLDLSYIEKGDIAAFTGLSSGNLNPSIYSTSAITTIIKTIGLEFQNSNQIIEFFDSTRNQNGAYYDSPGSRHPLMDTKQAITIFQNLDATPKEIDQTVNYLLSLQYDDGTFLTELETGISEWEQTRLSRITLGTAEVVSSLIMLGQKEKIPVETINALVAEIDSNLGDTGFFPDFNASKAWEITVAIELLVMVDPALILPRTKEFIVYQLNGLMGMIPDAYLTSSLANRLLYIGDILELPEIKADDMIDKLRAYLKDKIFPLQNSKGGFGFSELVDPLTTSEVILLSDKLEIQYPNLEKLVSELDRRWVGNGWAMFIDAQINSGSYISTYYALEIASFSGYDRYNPEKVIRFLKGGFSNYNDGIAGNVNLYELYYAVKAINLLIDKLNEADINNIKGLCLKWSADFKLISKANSSMFTYVIPLSREAGFELPEDLEEEIMRLTRAYKENLIQKPDTISPNELYYLYESVEEKDQVLTRDEVAEYLHESYDYVTGGYNSMVFVPQSDNSVPQAESRPELYQTCVAIKLLDAANLKITDRDKTYEFVMQCKHKYGFMRTPDAFDSNLLTIYAGVTILKYL